MSIRRLFFLQPKKNKVCTEEGKGPKQGRFTSAIQPCTTPHAQSHRQSFLGSSTCRVKQENSQRRVPVQRFFTNPLNYEEGSRYIYYGGRLVKLVNSIRRKGKLTPVWCRDVQNRKPFFQHVASVGIRGNFGRLGVLLLNKVLTSLLPFTRRLVSKHLVQLQPCGFG